MLSVRPFYHHKLLKCHSALLFMFDFPVGNSFFKPPTRSVAQTTWPWQIDSGPPAHDDWPQRLPFKSPLCKEELSNPPAAKATPQLSYVNRGLSGWPHWLLAATQRQNRKKEEETHFYLFTERSPPQFELVCCRQNRHFHRLNLAQKCQHKKKLLSRPTAFTTFPLKNTFRSKKGFFVL